MLVGAHPLLDNIKQFPVDDRGDGIFQPNGLVVIAVCVSGAISGVEGFPVDQRTDVFLIVQEVVQAVGSKEIPALGFDAVLV